MMDRTRDGKPFRMLCVIDEFTRECLAIKVERKLNSRIVLEILSELFLTHGPPAHIRSDNGPEFIATALREWLVRLNVKTLYIGDRIRSRITLGERILREFQLKTPG